MAVSDGPAIHSLHASHQCNEANPLQAVLPGTYSGHLAFYLSESPNAT
jgi:hypothetical protein